MNLLRKKVVVSGGIYVVNFQTTMCVTKSARKPLKSQGKNPGWGYGGIYVVHLFKNKNRGPVFFRPLVWFFGFGVLKIQTSLWKN